MLNRLLKHAARIRARVLARHPPTLARAANRPKMTPSALTRPNLKLLASGNSMSATYTFGAGTVGPVSDHILATARYRRWSEFATIWWTQAFR